MSGINSLFFFDKFENKFVFKVSRTFFWIFTSLAALLIVFSTLSFIYSIIPPFKDHVEMGILPAEPTIAYGDVFTEMNPPPPAQTVSSNESTQPVVQQQNYSTTAPIVKSKLDSLYDSLGTFFPGKWESIYKQVPTGKDFFGRPTNYETRLIWRGLKDEVQNRIEGIQGLSGKETILGNMIYIIAKFDSTKRQQALYAYLYLLERKWDDYNIHVSEIKNTYDRQSQTADDNFREAKNKKAELESKAAMGIGGGIVIVALLGLVLSFLAIERNTRTIRELIEKRGL